jgi:uncharacterized protein involved in outer membrane biogenesis
MKRVSRVRRWLTVAVVLVVLYTIIGFFVVPPIAKSQMQKRLSAELSRRVTVEKIRVNPYALSVTLEKFAILEKDNAATFVGWRKLYVNADALASIWREWAVSEIVLEGFESRVAINPDQSLNFSDILAKVAAAASKPDATPKTATAPKKPGRPVRVGKLQVTDARLDFSDRSRPKPFATTVGPMTFALTEFRTVPKHGAPYHFEAVTESGERFTWAGTLQAEPPASAGEFTVENIQLAKYAPYHDDRHQADLVDGKLTVRGRYDVGLAEGNRAAKLIETAVQLRSLKLVERATKETFAELPSLDVQGINADAMTMKASIKSIALNGGQLRVRREKDGKINLLALLEPAGGTTPPPSAATTSQTAPAAPTMRKPDVTIGELTVKDFRVEVSDQAAPRPAQIALGDIQFSLRNISLAEGAQMPMQLAFNWAPQGTVRIDGNVAIAPVKADLTIDVAALEILPLSPYLEQFVNARLTGGALNAGLIVEASMPAGQPPAASVIGGVMMEKFGLVDGARNEELAGFKSLTLRGLRAGTSPELSVALEEINLVGPFARVVMNQDKSLNLLSVVRSETPPAGPAPSSAPQPPPTAQPSDKPTAPQPKIEIARIVISDGDYRFTDRSLEPNVSMAINQFGGTIAGLSSTNPAKADLDLKATVDGAGPVAIAGKIDPLGATRSFDVKVDFKNVDLVPLSPYSGKFAGFELARGKLLLDVKASVVGNKIDSTNVITLNQFTFGSPVKSPDATSLPVRLGVALLKDMDGRIVIDVPVQGSTDDPSFRVGRVVLRVIVNLLTKAAVSPFSLLGAAFGGGGDELAFQEFEPGSTEIRPTEVKKLETMVKALTNRPGLSLDLQGSYDRAADGHALKAKKLAANVRRAVWEQKRAANPNIAPPAELTLTPEEEAAMIKRIYDDRFPPGTQFGAPIPPPPPMVQAPEPPSGFFPRLVAALTGQASREEKAAQEENNRRVAAHAKAIETAVSAGLPTDLMRSRLSEVTEVDDNDLRGLAQSRAQTVRDYFANVGKIAPERLFLAKDKVDPAKESKGARVMLGLQ